MVVFGGEGSRDTLLRDTWEWDGAAAIWAETGRRGVVPEARAAHAMAYDEARRRIVLFGGEAGPRDSQTGRRSAELRDVWEYAPTE